MSAASLPRSSPGIAGTVWPMSSTILGYRKLAYARYPPTQRGAGQGGGRKHANMHLTKLADGDPSAFQSFLLKLSRNSSTARQFSDSPARFLSSRSVEEPCTPAMCGTN